MNKELIVTLFNFRQRYWITNPWMLFQKAGRAAGMHMWLMFYKVLCHKIWWTKNLKFGDLYQPNAIFLYDKKIKSFHIKIIVRCHLHLYVSYSFCYLKFDIILHKPSGFPPQWFVKKNIMNFPLQIFQWYISLKGRQLVFKWS